MKTFIYKLEIVLRKGKEFHAQVSCWTAILVLEARLRVENEA